MCGDWVSSLFFDLSYLYSSASPFPPPFFFSPLLPCDRPHSVSSLLPQQQCSHDDKSELNALLHLSLPPPLPPLTWLSFKSCHLVLLLSFPLFLLSLTHLSLCFLFCFLIILLRPVISFILPSHLRCSLCSSSALHSTLLLPLSVQSECIPQAIFGTDIICQAKSGMGKTAVFVIATLQQLDAPPGNVDTLILCHTRELAYQICQEFEVSSWGFSSAFRPFLLSAWFFACSDSLAIFFFPCFLVSAPPFLILLFVLLFCFLCLLFRVALPFFPIFNIQSSFESSCCSCFLSNFFSFCLLLVGAAFLQVPSWRSSCRRVWWCPHRRALASAEREATADPRGHSWPCVATRAG